jgi:hypothetical protein
VIFQTIAMFVNMLTMNIKSLNIILPVGQCFFPLFPFHIEMEKKYACLSNHCHFSIYVIIGVSHHDDMNC